MALKIFDLPSESLSSSDNRVYDFLKKKYGKSNMYGGGSFSLTKEQLFQINKIFEKEKIEKIWGSSLGGKFGEMKLDFLKLVANKKLYLIYEVIDGTE